MAVVYASSNLRPIHIKMSRKSFGQKRLTGRMGAAQDRKKISRRPSSLAKGCFSQSKWPPVIV